MQTINDLINGKTTQQLVASVQTSQRRALPELEAIETLWGLMSSMYGHRWTSSFGAEVDPDHVWRACLKGISPEQIKSGMNQCALRAMEWPPSAPQFRALCLGIDLDSDGNDASWQHRTHARAVEDQSIKYARNSAGELVAVYPLTDQGKRQRAIEARNRHAEKLKSMFAGTGH